MFFDPNDFFLFLVNDGLQIEHPGLERSFDPIAASAIFVSFFKSSPICSCIRHSYRDRLFLSGKFYQGHSL